MPFVRQADYLNPSTVHCLRLEKKIFEKAYTRTVRASYVRNREISLKCYFHIVFFFPFLCAFVCGISVRLVGFFFLALSQMYCCLRVSWMRFILFYLLETHRREYFPFLFRFFFQLNWSGEHVDVEYEIRLGHLKAILLCSLNSWILIAITAIDD